MRIGRYMARTGVAGAVALGSLGLGGIAHAQDGESAAESEPKVIEGECASTVEGEDGDPLTLDALSAVGADDGPKLSTGTQGSEDGSLLALPVKETLDGLGLSRAEVVVNPLGQICDTAKSAVNTVGDTTRAITDVGGDESDEPEKPEDPAPEQPAPPEEPAPEPDEPDTPAPGSDDPAPGAPDEADLTPPEVPGPGAIAAPLDPVSLPPAAGITVPKAPVGPGMGVPEKGSQPGEQENAARKSGTAQALPQAGERDRTPLVLSVAALLVVVAGLSRSWIARKNA